ncbi:uncharacterized protein PAC_12656 [Phialocephala subalpina]|uniref:Uncharacterized protein n=1 Tax=Phialocephala subalpina TaxID=576137 RepID=A0A1L7XCJ7_9HELO|nr:uncharacterized protein PAC_12656 [Phialocephala subalpina]
MRLNTSASVVRSALNFQSASKWLERVLLELTKPLDILSTRPPDRLSSTKVHVKRKLPVGSEVSNRALSTRQRDDGYIHWLYSDPDTPEADSTNHYSKVVLFCSAKDWDDQFAVVREFSGVSDDNVPPGTVRPGLLKRWNIIKIQEIQGLIGGIEAPTGPRGGRTQYLSKRKRLDESSLRLLREYNSANSAETERCIRM